jgi:hypothetical protein
MSHNEHWDELDAFENSSEVRGPRRSNQGCITILLLLGIATLGLAYPWVGVPLLIIVIAIFVFRSPRKD